MGARETGRNISWWQSDDPGQVWPGEDEDQAVEDAPKVFDESTLSSGSGGQADGQGQGAQSDGQPQAERRVSDDDANEPWVEVRRVKKVTVVLLSVFLGCVGAQHIYSGHYILGALSLMVVWSHVPWFIGLVEGFVLMLKPADAEGCIVV